MRTLILGLAVLLGAIAPLGAVGGQEQPATVPTDLALALLQGTLDAYGSRAPVIVVGRAPDGMPPSLTSMQFTSIVGGMTESRDLIVVLKSALPPNQVLTAYDKHLTASGWGPPPPPPDAERGGFMSSPYESAWGSLYCADSAAVSISSSPAPNGGTYLKVRYSRGRELNFCSPQRVARMAAELKFPVLLPPRGMTQRGGGGGSSGDNISTSAQLMGALGPPDIVLHYAKQLEAAGWKMGSAVSSGMTSLASAEARDLEGALWRGALIAQRVSDLEVEVTLQMVRPSGR